MTSVQGRKCLHWECLSVAPSIAPSDSFSPPKSGDKLSDQPAGPSRAKPLANANPAATIVLKYSEDDLQQILKAILKAWAPVSVFIPAPASNPAPMISEMPREKLKAHSPDVYYGNSHMDCYNFCQQYEDYFATTRTMGPIQIPFAASFF